MSEATKPLLPPIDPGPSSSGRNDHYLGLDALRGVAALAVVWLHFSSRLNLPYLFYHGYLAVDFFFVLSGFVLARAYLARLALGDLAISGFYAMRMIRLMPLVILGTLLAAIIEFRRPEVADQGRHLSDMGIAVIFGSTLIPILWQTTLEQAAVFPLNAPAWSLFFEMAANAIFAPLARIRMGSLVLLMLMVSALAMLWGMRRFGSVDLGANPPNFWFGFARVSWSFTLGVGLFFIRDRAPHSPFWVSLIGLVLVLACPDLGPWNSAFDGACVFIVLPMLVLTASSARLPDCGRRASAISGELSYPIYAIHYPLVRAFGVAGTKLQLAPLGRIAFVMAATLAIVTASACIYAIYDRPIRRRLSAIKTVTA
jgi:peptidoglycan/LPS O-acetylase OafA/YrhL